MTKPLATALALTLALAALGAARPACGAEPEAADPLQIGTVRNDTLFVDRDRVIAAALRRNEMLAASGAMRDAAAGAALGAWRGFLPQVQVAEFFLRSDDALSSFGFKLQNRVVTQADFDPALLNAPGETNNAITRLQVLQPLFNGGMGLFGKQAADAASRAADLRHRRAAETVRLNAVQAYEGLVLAEAYGRVLQAAVASAEGHVRQARSLVANEMATEADLLQATVYLSGLQQRQIEVQNMAAVAAENIKLLTAVPTDLPLAADRPLDPQQPLSPPAAPVAGPPSQRSDLLARRQEVAAAGKMVKVARGAMLPHVNLSLQKDYYSMDRLFGSDADSWSLGVYATWDVFKGLQNVGELKKARAEHRAAGYLADFETRQAGAQATEAWLGAQAAWRKVQVAKDAVVAAREGLRIVSNQYREGLAGMVDLLDTQAAATMAEGDLVQALHDYAVGLANLEYYGAAGAPAALQMSEAVNPSRPSR